MKGISGIGLLAFSLFFTVACTRQAVPKPVFKAAIDNYYQAHPACLWFNEKTFPVKASADDAKSDGYDALVDQGLLTRTAAGRHQSAYKISANGLRFWISDPRNTGAGNFCYGHREVVSIDNASQVPNQPGYSSMVSYHYTVADAPAWASAPEILAAFPKLNNNGVPQMSIATLTDTNHGWQMNPPTSSAGGQSASAANEPAAAGKTGATD